MCKSNNTALCLLIISFCCFFLFILKHSLIALFITFCSLAGVGFFSHVNDNFYIKKILVFGLVFYFCCLIGTAIYLILKIILIVASN